MVFFFVVIFACVFHHEEEYHSGYIAKALLLEVPWCVVWSVIIDGRT
jgi:hypothetical protein